MPVLPMPDKARVLKDLHHLALVNKGGIPIEKLNRKPQIFFSLELCNENLYEFL